MTHRRSLLVLALLLPVCASCTREPKSAGASAENRAAGPGAADHGVGAHGDHTPHHGGTVYMNGDLHFEIVLRGDGNHRLYFSDAARAELPAAIASEVTFSTEKSPEGILQAAVDANGESWIVAGSPPMKAGETVRVAFVVDDEPYWIDVPYIVAAGTEKSKRPTAGQ